MGLRHRIHDLSKTATQHEADEIAAQADHTGCTPIAALHDRDEATVSGTIRSVVLPAKRGVPALVVEVFDGGGAANLVWIGRRSISGIEPGVFVRARGRVATVHGTPTMFNPAYEIVPR
jgi:RecG-like helicase